MRLLLSSLCVFWLDTRSSRTLTYQMCNISSRNFAFIIYLLYTLFLFFLSKLLFPKDKLFYAAYLKAHASHIYVKNATVANLRIYQRHLHWWWCLVFLFFLPEPACINMIKNITEKDKHLQKSTNEKCRGFSRRIYRLLFPL